MQREQGGTPGSAGCLHCLGKVLNIFGDAHESLEETGRGQSNFSLNVLSRGKDIEKIALALCFSQLPKSADDMRIKESRFEAHQSHG